MKAVARMPYSGGGRPCYFSLIVGGASVGWGIRRHGESWGARAAITHRWVDLDIDHSSMDDAFALSEEAARWILEQIPGCADLEIEWVK